MTDLTRRDALMLTAVIAATTSTVQAAAPPAPAPPPGTLPDNPSLLIPPTTMVASSSVPITVKIPEAAFTQNGLLPNSVIIDVRIVDADSNTYPDGSRIFKTTLQGFALWPVGTKSPVPDIVMMTRLKIPGDPSATSDSKSTQPVKKKVVAIITMTYVDAAKNKTTVAVNAPQVITVKNEDCALSDVSLLRLSLQPQVASVSAGVTVRAVVPPAPAPAANPGAARVPSHKLKTVTCSSSDLSAAPAAAPPALPPPAAKPDPHFQMDVADDTHLSDEVFVGFNLYPTAGSLFVVDWSYEPIDKAKDVSFDLKASTYAAVVPAKV
jgi:hypothetical protein